MARESIDIHMHESTLGYRCRLATFEDAQVIGHAALTQALDGETRFELIGKRYRSAIATRGLDDHADRGQAADIDTGLLEQKTVHGGIEVGVIDNIVDMPVGIVVTPARLHGAEHPEIISVGHVKDIVHTVATGCQLSADSLASDV